MWNYVVEMLLYLEMNDLITTISIYVTFLYLGYLAPVIFVGSRLQC